jgi:stearoyl-CoA desaturase (delta-9 desaturase)
MTTASSVGIPITATPAPAKSWSESLPAWVKAIPFFAIHLAVISVFFTSNHLIDWVLCFSLYVIRMFGITAGYHRYFAHKSYRTSRVFQFVLAWLGCSALQKGPLWWAGHHRLHHKHSDTDEDVHSPITKTVWDAHVGWILDPKNDPTHWHVLKDWTRYPELVWLNSWHWVPGILLGVACYFVSLAAGGTGWGGVSVGFILSTILLYHGTFTINSLSHLFGNRRYQTTDRSRNNPWLAIITLGEGWHNNHHHYQNAARQGFFWWEVDFSYYALQLMSVFGLVWGLKQPPKELLASKYRTTRDLAPISNSPDKV